MLTPHCSIRGPRSVFSGKAGYTGHMKCEVCIEEGEGMWERLAQRGDSAACGGGEGRLLRDGVFTAEHASERWTVEREQSEGREGGEDRSAHPSS